MTARADSRAPLQEHMAWTYFNLRAGVGVLGAILPWALWLGGKVGGGEPLRSSMSGYYYSPIMGDVFVGAVVAIGLFLFLYRGYSRGEDQALDVGGVCALGVALVPTTAPGEEASARSLLHGVVAVLFFFAIAYVCVRHASDTLSLIRDTRTARWFRRAYLALGVGMFALPLLTLILTKGLGVSGSAIFFVEAAAVTVFATYWLVKSCEIRRTDAERKALRGELTVFTPRNRKIPGRLQYHPDVPPNEPPPGG